MNKFLLVIHRDLISKDALPSPQHMQDSVKPFQDWLNELAVQNKLLCPPRRWDTSGRVIIDNNTVIEGPYAENKMSISGMLLFRATDYEEAIEIARGCPLIQWGAIVEIRMALNTL